MLFNAVNGNGDETRLQHGQSQKHPTRKREMLLIASAYEELAEHTREVSLLRRQHWIHFLPASTEQWLSVRGRPRS